MYATFSRGQYISYSAWVQICGLFFEIQIKGNFAKELQIFTSSDKEQEGIGGNSIFFFSEERAHNRAHPRCKNL